MRVQVLDDRCQGHTRCFATAPELFGLRDEDGHAYVHAEAVPAGLEEAARRAAMACPEQAIVVEEE